MSERRRMMMTAQGGGRLPSAYQEVEYIESNGTQYINTGYNPSDNTDIDAWLQYITLTSTETALFGVYISSPNILVVRAQQYAIRFYFGANSNSNSNTSELTTKIRYQVLPYYDETHARLLFGSRAILVTSSTFATSNPLYIFAQNNGSSVARYSSARLWSFDISEGGTPIRSFVPCYRKSDNKAGLYDLVGRQFYTDGNGGNFTVGSDV